MKLTDERFDFYVSRYDDHQEAYEYAVDATVACVTTNDPEGAELFAAICRRILELKSKGEIPWDEDTEHLWNVTKRAERARKAVLIWQGEAAEPSSSESEPSPPQSSSPERPASSSRSWTTPSPWRPVPSPEETE